MTEYKTTPPCKGCGKPIVWASTYEEEKAIPLDPKAPVYRVWCNADGDVKCERSNNRMVDHSHICTAAKVDEEEVFVHGQTCPKCDGGVLFTNRGGWFSCTNCDAQFGDPRRG